MATTPAPGGDPATQFVGRDDVLGRVIDLVHRERLISLVGPGGIGKTRLSLEIAGVLVDAFADGVVIVTLDSVLNPEDVAWRAASQISASDQSRGTAVEHVVRHLAGRELLLVIDNC